MVKQFSSPKRFASFQVVSASGEVAFQGGPPVREIPTDTLGAIRTVWVGDFTSLRIPGRYRIVTDDGISSYPFDIRHELGLNRCQRETDADRQSEVVQL